MRPGDKAKILFVAAWILVAAVGITIQKIARMHAKENNAAYLISSGQSHPSGIFGTWIYQTNLGNETIKLKPDMTGMLTNTEFKWTREGENGFSTDVVYDNGTSGRKNHHIFGHVTPSGDLFTNYDPLWATCANTEQTLFKKVE